MRPGILEHVDAVSIMGLIPKVVVVGVAGVEGQLVLKWRVPSSFAQLVPKGKAVRG